MPAEPDGSGAWASLASWECCSSAAPAFAQFDRGQISGVIKDETGGVMPGVTVTATQVATQTSRTTVTDASGFYTFPNLSAGRYDISAELQGFKKAVKEGIQLDATGSLTMDFSLATGALTEQVTVTAEQTLLQTDTGLRKTIEAKDIEQLSFSRPQPDWRGRPEAGRHRRQLQQLRVLGPRQRRLQHQRQPPADENNITVDGATAIRTRSNGAIVGIQNVDAIQEVQVLTGDYMPEYGRVSGGQIRMVTKSGSNRFSGSGSYFLRDDNLQANTWARNRSPNSFENSGAAPFDYKQYAYSVGGPVPFGGAEGQAVLLRGAGVGQLHGDPDQHGDRADREDAHRRLQRAAGPRTTGSSPAPGTIIDPTDRPAVPGQHHPGEPAESERHRDAERVSAADAGLPAGRRQTRSSRATTRRISARTTSASTTG